MSAGMGLSIRFWVSGWDLSLQGYQKHTFPRCWASPTPHSASLLSRQLHARGAPLSPQCLPDKGCGSLTWVWQLSSPFPSGVSDVLCHSCVLWVF